MLEGGRGHYDFDKFLRTKIGKELVCTPQSQMNMKFLQNSTTLGLKIADPKWQNHPVISGGAS